MSSLTRSVNSLMKKTVFKQGKVRCAVVNCLNQVYFRAYSSQSERGVLKSPYPDIAIPNCSIPEYVFKDLDKWATKTALVGAETGEEFKYEELYKMSMTFGANLKKKLKFSDGDVIGVILPNVPEYPIAVFGALQAGYVVSPINPHYTVDEVSRQLDMSGAKLVITTTEGYAVAKGAVEKLKKDIKIMQLAASGESIYENAIRFSEFSQDFSTDISSILNRISKNEDLSFLPYSSGTTGLPKGVELTQSNILANCQQGLHPSVTFARKATSTYQDNVIAILPFFHIYGLTAIMISSLAVGSKVITMAKFLPDLFLKTQEKYKTTVFFVAPPLALFLGGHPSVKKEHFDSMRIIVNGAAPLGASDIQRIISKSKKDDLCIIQGYGLTETSPVVAAQEASSTNYASIGHPLSSTEVKVVSLEDSKRNLEPFKEGELYVRGPQVMRGYRNNPEANAEVFIDGWFRTGDLAYYDDTGALYITDRVKELIKVKGYQVAPAELEAILRVHPSIADVAVIGMPHPKDGETPKAFIVLKPGKEQITVKEIKEFLSEKVSSYKFVSSVQYVDTIPKSAAGKILRRELKKL